MIITPKDKILLLRVSNYKGNDFVKKHEELIGENDNVWMLKVGKQIPKASLQATVLEKNVCIIKTAKACGGKYYLLYTGGAFNGLPREDMVFPTYYYNMIEDEKNWMIDSLLGTWICIKSIREIDATIIDRLRLTSNQKKVDEVLNSTRSSIVYVSPVDEIVI